MGGALIPKREVYLRNLLDDLDQEELEIANKLKNLQIKLNNTLPINYQIKVKDVIEPITNPDDIDIDEKNNAYYAAIKSSLKETEMPSIIIEEAPSVTESLPDPNAHEEVHSPIESKEPSFRSDAQGLPESIPINLPKKAEAS